MRRRRFLAGAAATLAELASSAPDEVERTLSPRGAAHP